VSSPILHLRPGSPSWPDELATIEPAPAELWIAGRLEAFAARPRVAIVGTRSPTPYGVGQARRFAAALATSGVCVVSGLARGIDQAAHEAALDAGGTTLAVLGSAVDRPWPAGPFTERLRREGALVSELPPGTGPRRHHFPLRNRLISGLAESVLVVEAAWASGSLITAHWAADQGRAVFVLPGRVDHPMARGCHRLLREGASLVESPDEILAELGRTPLPPEEEPSAGEGAATATALVRALVRALEGETATPDELAHRVSRPASDVLGELVELELGGTVVRAPGGLFRLAQRGERRDALSPRRRRAPRGSA